MANETRLSSKLYRGLKSQTLITISIGLIQLAYFSVMSRLLDKEDFGLFAVVTAVATILSEISQAGLGAAVIQKKGATYDYISTAFILSILIGGFGMLVLFSLSSFLSTKFVSSDTLTIPFCLISLSIFFTVLNSVSSGLFIKELKFYELGIIQFVSNLISSLLGVYMAFLNYGVYALVIAMLLNTLAISLVSLFLQRKKFSFKISKEYVTQILAYGGWLTGSGVVRSIYNQMDRLITGRWISVGTLGIYTRASGFVITIISHVNTIFDTILFPILSDIQDDQKRMSDAYRKCTDLIFLMSFIVSFSFILVAEIVIYIFLGEKWMDTSLIFKIISVSILLHPFGRICDSFFRSIGIVKQYFCVRVVLCISSVLLIFIGCKFFSVEGLAVAYVLSRLVDVTLKIWVLGKYTSVKPWDLLKQPILNFLIIFLLFFLSYSLYRECYFIIGNILSVLTFVFLLAIVLIFNHRIFGDNCYNYLYCNVAAIITEHKRTCLKKYKRIC